VEVCAVELLTATEVGERLQEVPLPPDGGVTVQVSATVPENELDGVTVMVEVALVLRPTRMLALLVTVKLVLPLLGACQKSPQPAKPATNGAAASNNHARFPIFIAAPLAPYSSACSQVTASPRTLSRCRTANVRTRPIMEVDAARREFAYRTNQAASLVCWPRAQPHSPPLHVQAVKF
jgi:hypothetical protein